jgi:hypothetical protein
VAFRSKNLGLSQRAVEILKTERPMTLRQLYYRLISAGVLRNDQKEYKRLGQVMTRLREDRQIPRTWIVDHVRTTLKPSSWTGLADFGESVPDCYRKDFWASLDHHVEVFVEKDAIAGTLQPVTHEYDVALRVCRGYSSVSFAGEIADEWCEIDKPIFAYYVGDFDPSGFDLERDLREKLERYSGKAHLSRAYFGGWDEDLIAFLERQRWAESGAVAWVRLAVHRTDFEEHDLIALPVKTDDKRAKGFLAEHGNRCAEVDALPPTELRDRVRRAIESHVDTKRWNRLRQVEAKEQESINRIVQGRASRNGT